MTLITGTVETIAGAPDPARWVFASPVLRESSDGDAVVTTKRVAATPVAGVVSVDLDPGPCVVTHKNAAYQVTVPATDVDLWDLISSSVAIPPATTDAVIAAAVAAYLELHPVEGGGGGGASLSVSRTATTVTVASDSGTDATLPAADSSNAGVMTAAMQTKLAAVTGVNTGDQDLSGFETTAAAAAALAGKAAAVHSHAQTDVTGLDTALAAKEGIANRGAANGYAPLDSSQLVPAIFLPSYVDDVLEFANVAAFPGAGTAGKIYVALDSNKTYRWSGSGWVEVSPGPGSTDSVVEGSANLYYPAADKAKLAGVAAGATANATDAQLRDRATHTGTQTPSTTLAASGTPTSATVLYGDNRWAAPAVGSVGTWLDYATQGTQPATPATGTVRFFAGSAKGLDAVAWMNSLGVQFVVGRDLLFYARNTTGSTLTRGTAVYIASASGGVPQIAKAQADATMTKFPAAGLVVADIANNAVGAVMMKGVLSGVNTGGMGDGSTVYVSAATAGLFTATAPAHPSVEQAVGIVEDANATTGTILVNCSPTNLHRIDGTNQASFAIGDATGTTKSLLVKNTAATGTLSWNPSAARTLTLPDVTATLATTADVALKAPLSVTLNTQTASYTLALGDAGNVVEVNNASANTLTVPPNSTVAFPTGTLIEICQYGAGQTTITPGAGVTIRSAGAKLKLTAQYSTASLRKRGTDEWVAVGDLSA